MRDGNIVACKPGLEQYYILYVLMDGSHTVNLSIHYVDNSLFARFWDQILPFLMGYVRTGPLTMVFNSIASGSDLSAPVAPV